jgi:NADH-quinone oxidoreductase subunit N
VENQLIVFAPEALLLATICLLILLSLIPKIPAATFIWLARIALLMSGVFFAYRFNLTKDPKYFLPLLLCGVSFIAFLFFTQAWFSILSLFTVLGMFLLSSADNMLVVFLSLELLSLPLYIMTAMSKEQNSAEAAIKFFVLNGVGISLILFGMSLLYGATGSISLEVIKQALLNPNIMLSGGLIFVTAGLATKLGLAPFHSWLGDVYTTGSAEMILFLGSAPKIALIALLLNLAAGTHVLQAWAVLSIVIGSIAPVVQTDIKRLLALSAIAQLGFAALGLNLFYIVVYSLMFLGAFAIASLVDNFQGLSQRQPKLAFLMLVFLLGLTGMPPFAGFMAKFGVLAALFTAHKIGLAIFVLIFSVIAAYYYLKIIKQMYFEPDAAGSSMAITITPLQNITITFLGILTLLLGIFPFLGI